jgi:NurA-like 5'-3' nuclease
LLGARPYPYILHRAHETALVSRDEKGQVELMLALELRKAGSEVEERSNKQSAKSLPGKGKR